MSYTRISHYIILYYIILYYIILYYIILYYIDVCICVFEAHRGTVVQMHGTYTSCVLLM